MMQRALTRIGHLVSLDRDLCSRRMSLQWAGVRLELQALATALKARFPRDEFEIAGNAVVHRVRHESAHDAQLFAEGFQACGKGTFDGCVKRPVFAALLGPGD